MANKLKQYFYHTFLPILLGVFIYAYLRKDSIFFIHPKPTVNSNFIFKFLQFYLVDALWAYSFCSTIILTSTLSSKGVAILSILFVSAMELITALSFNQTFDWWDIVVMIIACFLALKFCKK